MWIPAKLFVACFRGLRCRSKLRSIHNMRSVKVSTLVLCGALLMTLHVILSGLNMDWGDRNSPPFTDHRRRVRPGFAPRPVPSQQQPCQSINDINDRLALANIPVLDHKVTKVLVLTYLRAGGAMIGQLFDKSGNTTYWYEPVDGILSDLYGTHHGWQPLDVFTNKEGTPRHVPNCEEEAIVQHLSSLYHCRLGGLPVDIFTSPSAIQPSWRTDSYLPCLRQVLVDVKPHNNPTGFSANAALTCKELLRKHCPMTFTHSERQLYHCFERIQDLKSKTHIFLNDVKASKDRDGPLWVNNDDEDDFVSYGKCMASVQYHAKKCLPFFNSICNSSDMVAVKTTRLRGEQLAKIMLRHPDLKIVHFVRDPRGIALSREKVGSLSEVSQNNYMNEAVLLCQRMRYDLIHLDLLKRQFKNNLIRVHYEEFLQDPETIGRMVYDFIGHEMPKKVEDWLKFKTKQLMEHGEDGPKLKDMSKQAFKWRRQMPDSENLHIVNRCRDVLESLNYPTLETNIFL